jgi:hypothetical protein
MDGFGLSEYSVNQGFNGGTFGSNLAEAGCSADPDRRAL